MAINAKGHETMRLIFHPVRSDAALDLRRRGDALEVNGTLFDFAALPEGAELPPEAMASPVFCGPVRRVDGGIEVNLLLPHGAGAGVVCRHPAPLDLTGDGPVNLPTGQEA
jgi:hypothetical protein